MSMDGIRSTLAHDRKDHPLDQAHTPTASWSGALVYVVCGWQGCPQLLKVDAARWEAERARRRAAAEATALSTRVWDRQAPSSRWLEVAAGPQAARGPDGRGPTRPGGGDDDA